MMDNPEIRKELLGRSNAWIAERIASVEATNAALLEACEYALRETVRPSSDPLIKALKAAIRKARP